MFVGASMRAVAATPGVVIMTGSTTRRISGAYCPLRRALPSKLPTGVPLAGFSRAGAVDTVGAVGDGGGGKSSDSSSPGEHRRESSEFGVYDM